MTGLFRQSVFGRLAGHENANDAEAVVAAVGNTVVPDGRVESLAE